MWVNFVFSIILKSNHKLDKMKRCLTDKTGLARAEESLYFEKRDPEIRHCLHLQLAMARSLPNPTKKFYLRHNSRK